MTLFQAKTMLEVLQDKVLVGDGCWQWTGAKDRSGYGFITRRYPDHKTTERAHRVVYELLVGPIPDGLQLDHLCRNTSCVRPAHLEPVTPAENIQRSDAIWKEQKAKTHCVHGHELAGNNLYVWPGDNGHARRCGVCLRKRALDRYYRNRDRAVD